MKTYVALLRGLNGGGRNALPMRELVAMLEELGCLDVKTYHQSGNVVFRSATNTVSELASKIGLAVSNRRGFKPHVMLLPAEDLERAMAANPFPQAESDPKALHIAFLNQDSIETRSFHVGPTPLP